MRRIKSLINYIKSLFIKELNENGIYKWPPYIIGNSIKQKDGHLYIDGYEMFGTNKFKRSFKAFWYMLF